MAPADSRLSGLLADAPAGSIHAKFVPFQQYTVPKLTFGTALKGGNRILVTRVPEDHMATFLVFHRGQVGVDFPRANLGVGKRDRDIFAS